jgi:hypothetical protein
VTQERLKKLLHYDSDTGVFTWNVSPRSGMPAGSVAGCLGQGYWLIRVDTVLYKRSRLAWLYMTGQWPINEIDHDNRVRSDDRWKNLRDLTPYKNSHNVGLKKNNTSGHMGVSWDKKYQKWESYIMLHRKKQHLGYFHHKEGAVQARKTAERIYTPHVTR